jgi:hypothetical protein
VLLCKTARKGSSDARSCYEIWYTVVDLMEEKDNYRSGQLESVELPEEDDTDDSSEVKGMVVETRDKRRKEDNNPFSAAPQKQIRTRSPRTPDKEILAQRKKNPQRKRRPVKKTPLARKNTAESRKKDCSCLRGNSIIHTLQWWKLRGTKQSVFGENRIARNSAASEGNGGSRSTAAYTTATH